MSLRGLAEKVGDVLKPFGVPEVLLYYSIISSKLKGFAGGREIAGKNHVKGRLLLKRGSQLEPLDISELSKVDEKFLELRKTKHLKDIEGKIPKVQEKLWRYFLPRKFADLFYAANYEKGNEIRRIFYDIDRTDVERERVKEVALKFIELTEEKKPEWIKGKPFVMWTGDSFHIYLNLKKPVNTGFYERNIRHDMGFTLEMINELDREFGKIKGGHEKKKGHIIIDPSQTPPGKLARLPFSLHVGDKGVDGIAVPLSRKELENRKIIEELEEIKAGDVIKNLDKLGKNIPSGWL
ncbi:hypothetical protein JXB01_03955 [Candidatus Micrarchaeota archaeon]|nr:hypothetical protein [Candidatus Micrarchaeota archaeon]